MRRLLLASVFAIALPAVAADTVVGPGTAPDLTVYGGDFALVRENRTIKLTDGENHLAFTGVSRTLQPETATIQVVAAGPKAPEVKILDQTFAFNLLSQDALLEQAVGREVSVVTTNPASGRDTVERARVLSVQNGLVLEIGGKIHTGVPGRIVFDSLPGNLRPVPTLLMTAIGPSGADIPIELAYLTNGLGWKTDYVATYDGDAGRMDITAWATVTNTTGAEFKDAKLRLAAGDVNRVAPPRPMPMMRAGKSMEMAMAAAPAQDSSVTNRSFEGLNIYTIPRPVTLLPGESKQLALMRATNLSAKREYVVRGQPWFYTSSMVGQHQEGRAEIEVIVKNEGRKAPAKGKQASAEPEGLGGPLPAGVVRAYGQDQDGAPAFLGEDRIDHVAEGGEIKLHFGRDLDVPTTRDQVNYVKASEKISLSVWRIVMRNTKAKPVTVRVSEPISGDWEISKENLPHTKATSGAAEWTVPLPPKGEMVLEYTVKTSTP